MRRVSPKARAIVAEAKRLGFATSFTNGGHLRFIHPHRRGHVYAAATPSCPRAYANARATLRRVAAAAPEVVR